MDALQIAVAELFDALAMHGRAAARGTDDVRTTAVTVGGHVATVATLAEPHRAKPTAASKPPRAVALAMAQAIFSAPHLSRTLSVYTTASEHVVFHPSEALAEALGLSELQLEEVRNEIDLKVAQVLRRSRVLHWLWHRAGNPRVQPDPLFHMLFPGAVGPTADHFSYRGNRLYAVVDQPHPPPPEALYLQWLPGQERWTCVPDTHFHSRYLDPALTTTIGRAVGMEPAAIASVLDDMVCTVPLADEDAFTMRDRWRNEGWAELTGLGVPTPGSAWLTLPLAADAVDPEGWIAVQEEGLVLQAPARVFDRLAMTRLTAMMHGLYAELCARLLAGRKLDAVDQSWIFDLDPYIQRVLQPLLDWAASPSTRAVIADVLQVDRDHVGAALAKVREGWLKQARTSWGGAPTPERPYTVQGILAAHLAATQASLSSAYHRPPDARADHHRILLLFFASYMQQASLGRLWRPVDGKVPPVEDVVGTWFWPTWSRVLDAVDP